MFKKIWKIIKEYDTIVIARHIGVDPDAMASQIGLRDAISLTFPKKKVYAVGNGTSRFNYIGKLDKMESFEGALLIVVDTPDQKRVDLPDLSSFAYKIKIDHHPYMETFCDLEYIDDTACSASEIIMQLIEDTKLSCNQKIAETLFAGLVSDSNRFLFNSVTSKTFSLVSRYLKNYPFDLSNLYHHVYSRPLSEVRLQGYIGENMAVTDNGVGYIKITEEILNKFHVDTASAGNMANEFNFIEEILAWVIITDDPKNDRIRINIRSRGPEVNKVAERYHGGGHKFAAGAKVSTFEEAMLLVNDLDEVTKQYIEEHDL